MNYQITTHAKERFAQRFPTQLSYSGVLREYAQKSEPAGNYLDVRLICNYAAHTYKEPTEFRIFKDIVMVFQVEPDLKRMMTVYPVREFTQRITRVNNIYSLKA